MGNIKMICSQQRQFKLSINFYQLNGPTTRLKILKPSTQNISQRGFHIVSTKLLKAHAYCECYDRIVLQYTQQNVRKVARLDCERFCRNFSRTCFWNEYNIGRVCWKFILTCTNKFSFLFYLKCFWAHCKISLCSLIMSPIKTLLLKSM